LADFLKSSNIKFHENLSSRSRTVPCGQMDRQTDDQTNMMKLTVAFCNFANAPKKYGMISDVTDKIIIPNQHKKVSSGDSKDVAMPSKDRDSSLS
jgi:hypothetical protein